MNMTQELGAHLSGLEQMQALIAAGFKPPIAETLKFDLVEVGPGRAVFEAEPGLFVYNPIGSVHGGYIATLLDSACGCAMHTALKPGYGYTTLELKVAYHKAVTDKTGRIRCEGLVMSSGRRAGFSEAKLTDAQGRLLASATSSLLIFEV